MPVFKIADEEAAMMGNEPLSTVAGLGVDGRGSRSGLLLSVLLAGVFMLGFACDKKKTQGPGGVPKKERDKWIADLDRIERVLGNRPELYPEQRIRLKVIERKAATVPEIQDRAGQILKAGKKGFDAASTKAFEALRQTIETALAKNLEEGRSLSDAEAEIDQLEEQLKDFPEIFMPQHYLEHEQLRRKLFEQRELVRRYQEVLEKAARMRRYDFYEGALGLLESFILVPRFASSTLAKKVEAEIKVTEAAAAEWEKKKSEEEEIPWAVLFKKGDDLINFTVNPDEAISVEAGVIVVDNRSNGPATLVSGDEEWQDYVVELEFQIVRAGFDLGLRMTLDEEAGEEYYDTITFTSEKYGALNWVKVQVKVMEETAQVISFQNFDVEEVELSRSAGRIFLAVGDTNKVRFRTIRVKVLK